MKQVVPVIALTVVIPFAAAACGGQSGALQSGPSAPKPGTLAADCKDLVGSRGLVGHALAFAESEGVATANPDGNTDASRLDVQEGLFKTASRADKTLADPIGQLVDFLDDPPTYSRKETLIAKVRSAASDIQRICAR